MAMPMWLSATHGVGVVIVGFITKKKKKKETKKERGG